MTLTAGDWVSVWTVRSRVATSIDLRDWPGLRACVTDPLTLDYSSHDPRRAPGSTPADDWIDYLRTLFPGLDATSHQLTGPIIELDGDRASSRVQVVAEHILDGARFTIGGHYDDTYRRTPSGWLVASMALTVRWTDGDPELLTRGLHRGAALRGDDARTTPPGTPPGDG